VAAERTCRWITHAPPFACGATPAETQFARLIFGATNDMPVPIDLCEAHTKMLEALEAARLAGNRRADSAPSLVVLPESPGRSRSAALDGV
jgi:hypothetical protein